MDIETVRGIKLMTSAISSARLIIISLERRLRAAEVIQAHGTVPLG